ALRSVSELGLVDARRRSRAGHPIAAPERDGVLRPHPSGAPRADGQHRSPRGALARVPVARSGLGAEEGAVALGSKRRRSRSRLWQRAGARRPAAVRRDRIAARSARWRACVKGDLLIVLALAAGAMPPENRPQPAREERELLERRACLGAPES